MTNKQRMTILDLLDEPVFKYRDFSLTTTIGKVIHTKHLPINEVDISNIEATKSIQWLQIVIDRNKLYERV